MKKRVLSALLAVGMACSLAATAFATDLPGMATPESASYDLAEQDPAEDAASGEPAAVEAEPTPTPDAAEQPTPTPAPTADATAEPAPESEEEDAPVQTPVPLAPATAESAAAFDASQVMENGAKVTVQAAEGVLPAGARLETGMLTDADTLARLESALQEVGEYDGFLALDIGFTLEGEPVEPAGDVQVAIELPAGALAADADPDTLALVHFAEEGEALAAEVVDAAIEPQAENNAAAASISLMALDAATAETAASDSPAVNLTFTIRSFSPFAVAWQAAAARAVNDATLRAHTVQGLTPFGTTINLFDYWISAQDDADNNNPADYKNQGINAGHILNFGAGMGQSQKPYEANETNVNQWTQTAQPRTGIVQNELGDDGYPHLNANVGRTESLSYLFDGTDRGGKASYMDVGGLLQVDELGYYYYDSQKNFAQFRESESGDGFVLYDTWGVKAGGASPDGQFFPFNDVQRDEIFTTEESGGNLQQAAGLKSTDAKINHYFGLSMSTRFIQQYGGHTTEDESLAVTYNFSGDDDVWIFIDGTLVGDLGGIHDATSIEINFATGDVIVYNDSSQPDTSGYRNNKFDEGEEFFSKAKIGRLLGYNADTLPDNTYHTLNFFYLERGNTDSNLSLKYNLVTIPETDIYKVDQDEKLVAGAKFELYYADSTTGKPIGEPICDAVTKDDGSVVLLNEDGYPVTVQQIYDKGTKDSKRIVRVVLKETTVPNGYRKASTGDITLYLQQFKSTGNDDIVVMLSENPWTTGVYALPKTLVLADSVTIRKDGQIASVTDEGLLNGTLFAVVEKKGNNEEWHPVTGTPISGWKVWEEETGIPGAIKAANTQANVFVLSTSGAYQVEISGLPGRIQDYQYLGGDGFRVSYYFSEAGSLANATTKNTYAVQNSGDFERQMSARLYIPNIVNRIAVQKVDSVTGDAVNGATIALYADDDVTKNSDGSVTLNEGAEPVATEETEQLTMKEDSINLNGGVVFDNLRPGTYWIKETAVPNGYTINDNFVKVIVDGTGVYADAGEENDGIQVTRGVGRLVRSMLQFAVDDRIDVTLHNIVATLQNGTLNGNTWDWETVSGKEPLHLRYTGGNEQGYTLDYAPEDADGAYSFKVDTGIPRLKVEQCTEHNPEDSGAIKQILTDKSGEKIELTNLYTGTTVVHIADDALANLKIEKNVTGLPEETDIPDGAAFTFTVTATGQTAAKVLKYGSQPDATAVKAGSYYLADANGHPLKSESNQLYAAFEKTESNPLKVEATVTILGSYFEADQTSTSITILGLPVGQYTVTENTTDTSFPKDIGIYTFDEVTYSVSDSGNNEDTNKDFTLQSPKKEADALKIQTTTVTATNEYKQGVRELLVKKTVEGDMGDTTQDFDFTLKLTKGNNEYNEPLPVVYNGVDGTLSTTLEAEDNTYTFQLCHNQSIKITVPAGYTATVTETTTGQGYTVESRQYLTTETPESGGILDLRPAFASKDKQEVTMNDDYTVEFRNTRDVVAPTGLESNHTKPYTLMVAAAGAAGLALVGAAVARYLRRRRQE